MFQTYSHARIPSHPAFPDEPMLWAAVEHDIHRPRFYVCVVEHGDGMQWSHMVLVGHERSLQSLMESQRSNWLVKSVLVVTPAHVNGSDSWQLDKLERLLLFADPGSELTLTYKVDGNRSYVTGDASLAQSSCTAELLFDASMLGRVAGDHEN